MKLLGHCSPGLMSMNKLYNSFTNIRQQEFYSMDVIIIHKELRVIAQVFIFEKS
jgi:hypothetical protein